MNNGAHYKEKKRFMSNYRLARNTDCPFLCLRGVCNARTSQYLRQETNNEREL